jgi:transposase InsO family protein
VSSDGESEAGFRDDEDAITLALFRYQVIARIVDASDLARGEVVALVREIVSEKHYLPGEGQIEVRERTVYDWIRAFRNGGIEALRPKLRKDKGTFRALTKEQLERAAQLRRENPKRFTSTLLDILVREGTLKGTPPHRATLDRHLREKSASRRQLGILGTKRTIKMEFDAFGDLWVGDYHHGPVVLAPNGEPATAKLGAFIDHKTRYPVADRYYLQEDLTSLRDTMLRAVLRFGTPKKTYVDRGAVYRAEQLAYSLRRVDSILIHSRAYYSQGRGVIERWWQVADAFESEISVRSELVTIHELNRLWDAWRELRYCEHLHSEIGKTPNEAIAAVVPKPIDPAIARELFLIRAKRTVNEKTACVSVEKHSFQCESWLRGRKIEVRYDLSDMSSVLIFLDGKRVQRAFPRRVNELPEPHPKDPAETARQSVDYLALLRRDYDQRLLEHARPLAYANLEIDDTFDAEAFVKTICDLAGLEARPAERRELVSFWDAFGPLPESLVRIATEHALRLHGRKRHPQVYLHAIRTLVLAHWQGPQHDKEKDR